jgi:hypothetical protein
VPYIQSSISCAIFCFFGGEEEPEEPPATAASRMVPLPKVTLPVELVVLELARSDSAGGVGLLTLAVELAVLDSN